MSGNRCLVAALCSVLVCGCAARGRPTPPAPGSDAPGVVLSSAGATGFSVRGGDGSVEVRPSPDDSIRVRLDLSEPECRATIRLNARRSGDRIELTANPSAKDRCNERWIILAPDSLAVSARMEAADVVVGNMRGGTEIDLGHGTITVDATGGDVRASVENGDVIVSTTSVGYGAVDATAQVGRVEVRLDGLLVRHARPPGPGDRIQLAGESRYDIRLRTTVGNIRLAVGDSRNAR